MSFEKSRFLMAVDLGQENAGSIVDECALWADALHATLDLGFVNPSHIPAPHVPDRHFREVIEARSAARAQQDRVELGSLVDRLPDAVRGGVRYSQGSPRDHLLAWAKDYDALIVATHGLEGVSRALLGSVAETLIRRSPVPVLVLRLSEVRREASGLGSGRILCALDIHDGQSIERLAGVGRWAEQLGSTVDLLYVGADLLNTFDWVSHDEPVGKLAEEFSEHERAMLAGLLETLPENVRGKAVYRVDSAPADSIAAAADGYDLLALYTHGRTGLGRFFMGSVAERVIRMARVPTLVLPVGVEGVTAD